MVSSLLVDALTNPTDVLLELSNAGNGEQLPQHVSSHVASIFAAQDAFDEITVLDLHTSPQSLRPRSLVRFDCMVQDTACSPEIYLSRRSNGQCGGWGLDDPDGLPVSPVNYTLLRECSIVVAVSIPGQTAWCSNETVPNPDSMSLLPHKYPLPATPHLAVQIKIYDSTLAEPLRTTDLYSFVGIITSDPWNTSLESAQLPAVPTIHVLFSRKIAHTVVPRLFPDPSFESPVPTIREQLISWIAEEALIGDLLAAEWVLLAITSRVQSRAPPILPLSLTLSGYGPSQSRIPKLIQALSLLVPMLSVLPLSLNVLNTTAFAPESKDEDLHSGWLQLPKGALCVVSEVPLDEGNVSERGVYNLRTLQDTMANQTLDYVFPFSQFSFETDINFLVLAAGRKSTFFKTQLEIPIQGQEESLLYAIDGNAIRPPSPQVLSDFRKLIGGARTANVTLDDTTAAFIQEDFVKERQAASSNKNAGKNEVVTSDDLIIRMMVAKLLAATLHKPEVTSEIWEQTKVLDGRRKARTLA